MLTLSCFTDEAGEQNMDAGYYMATLVFHNQSKRLERFIDSYVARLQLEDLHDIPFHSVDLLHGHEDYEGLSVEKRKRLLVAFSMFVRTLPISYHTFSYDNTFVKNSEQLQSQLRKDIVDFIFDRLEKFQTFDQVAIYYDGGQEAVTAALHGAFDYALARNAAVYKPFSHQDKRLAQAADYLCTIELAEKRYATENVSSTYQRFFGSNRNFRQNFLKQVRRKLA